MKLFERINIGTMQLKNRVVLAPMGTTTDHTYGFNERDVDYYGERAKGGDNVRPGKIIDAIAQGYNYIRVLD